MKALILALALFGDTPIWPANMESFAGITCPTRNDALRVASVQQTYSLASTLDETRCLFVAFEGRRLGELDDFSIGGTLYSFTEVQYEGFTVYVLNIKGEGWTA